MPLYLGTSDAGTSSYSLQDFEPSAADKMNASVREAWLESYGPVATDWWNARQAEAGETKLSAIEAAEIVKSSGVKLKHAPEDQQYTRSQLDVVLGRQRELTAVKDVRDRTPWDLGSPIRGAAMFAAGVVDPINLAAAFLPWTRFITALNGLRVGLTAESLLTRTGARAALGAADAGISTIALEPVYAGMRNQLGDDYGAMDSMANIAFGTAFGGGVHALGGAGADAFRHLRGADPLVTPNPAAEPIAPPAGAVMGAETFVRVGQGREPAQFAVVEADSLSATVDKADNQFRDRSRAAYQTEIQQRANALDPDLVLSTDNPLMDVGTPTIAADGRIIGGNGRTMFIDRAYEIGKGADYRAALEARLEQLGIDPAAVAGMKKPVLVRRLQREVDVRQAAMASNEGGSSDMSALEQAKVDAERLGDARLAVSADGDLQSAENRAAIRRWVEAQPENKRNSLVDEDGRLSAEGLRRLNGALLYKAYGDSPTLGRLVESMDPGSRNIAMALGRTAPTIANAHEAIKAGDLHPRDIAPDVQMAVEKFNALREQGTKIHDYLNQLDAFGDGMTDEARLLLDFMGRNIQSPRRIAEVITGFYDRLNEAGNPKQGDMFGGSAGPDKMAMLDASIRAAEQTIDTAAEVLAQVSPETREAALRASVAQSVDGRQVDVDAIVGMDEARQTATIEDAKSAADRNFDPDNDALADVDASRRVEQRVQRGPKDYALKEAQEAAAEADTLLSETVKAGDEAYKFAVGKVTADPAVKLEALTEEVRKSFGRDTDALLQTGGITIVATPRDIPRGPHPGDVKAATAPDGRVYIVASNVSPKEVRGLVLHEVGVHVGMREMLGDDLFGSVLQNLDDAILRGEEWAQRARAAVPADTPAQHVREEQLAYLVMNAPDLPLVKRIVAAIRAWVYRNFKFAQSDMKLTEADFRAMAVSALHDVARRDLDAASELRYAKGQDGRARAEFGPVYTEYRNDPAGAIAELMRARTGEAIVDIEGLGDVSLIYGDSAKGLAHIAARRGEEWLQKVPDVLQRGVAYSKLGHEGRVYIGTPGEEAVLRLDWDGKAKTWVVSAYDRAGVNIAEGQKLFVREGSGAASSTNLDRLAGADRGPQSRRSDVIIERSGGNENPDDAKYARGDVEEPPKPEDELKPYNDAVVRAQQMASVLRAAAAKLDNDAQAAAAMRAAMPDITATEIDELLGQLRASVKGLRGMARDARSKLTAEDRATELQDEAMQAADELANNIEKAAVIEKRNAALNMNARLKAASFLKQFAGNPKLDVEGFRALLVGTERRRQGGRISVDAEQKNFRGEWLGGMETDLRRSGQWEAAVSGKFDEDTYIALYRLQDDVPNFAGLAPEAVEIAKIINKYQSDARATRNRFGAWIRDLKGYITRQSHDMYKIRDAGEKAWKEKVLPLLDLDRTLRNYNGDIDDFLTHTYDDFAAGSHMKPTTDDADIIALGRGASLAKRESASRVLYFKDGAAAFAYNRDFGSGRLLDSVMHGLDQSAQAAGLMKVLGTNPEYTLNRLFDEYAENLRGDPARRAKFLSSRKEVMENLLGQVDGSTNIPGNVTAAKVGSFLRAWQSMAKLGGALISSITDLTNYAAELRYGQDKNLLTGVLDGIGAVVQGRAKGEKADILASLGVFHESVLGSVFARFDSPDLVGGKMSAMMQLYFKANGLTWWTESLRDGYALQHSNYLASQTGKAWDKLPESLRDMLGLYNIDAGKWDILRLSALREVDGRRYMTPDGIKTVPTAALENYITQVGRAVSDAAILNLQDDLMSALRTMTIDRTHHAVIEPNARARAFMLRGTQPGTVTGELLRYVGQFKSFPVAMIQMVLGREVYGRGYDTLGDYLKNGKGDMLGLATFIGLSTMMGYAAMSIKDLLRGKNPRPVDDPRTWAAAMVQGGGLGIYGDFLFNKYNRMGGTLSSSIAGPVVNLADTAADLWTRVRTGDDFGAVAFNAALANTPFMNLFYTRAALDYLVIYQMQEAMNPGFLRRMERRAERENGQTYWLPPSQVVR